MDVEVRIISMNPNPTSLQMMRNLFDDVAVTRAVDLRSRTAQQLFNDNLITSTAATTMLFGKRKWHREFTAGGAVGLVESMKLVLRRHRSTSRAWTLICEEDCRPAPNLRTVVERLMHGYQKGCRFDAAMIGSSFAKSSPSCIDGFHKITGYFLGMHCFLVSPDAHVKLSNILSVPLNVQVDSLFSEMILLNRLYVIGQVGERSAKQSRHQSTIQQAHDCPLCNVNPSHGCHVTHKPCQEGRSFRTGLLVSMLIMTIIWFTWFTWSTWSTWSTARRQS